jgi:hypothetical protein
MFSNRAAKTAASLGLQACGYLVLPLYFSTGLQTIKKLALKICLFV